MYIYIHIYIYLSACTRTPLESLEPLGDGGEAGVAAQREPNLCVGVEG